uniref:Transmembrane protein n=1 Tax=Panagrellus redivivus TaxID=6233 RepID=A0A7E4W0B5_PANRE
MRYLSAKRRVPMMDLTEKYPDTVHPTPPPNCTTMKSVIFVLFTVLCVTPVSTYRNQTWYYKIVAKILCNGTPVKRGVALNFLLGSKTVNTVRSLPKDDGGVVAYSDFIEYQVPFVPDLKVQFMLPICPSCGKYTQTDRNLDNYLFLEPKYAEKYPWNATNIDIVNLCKK